MAGIYAPAGIYTPAAAPAAYPPRAAPAAYPTQGKALYQTALGGAPAAALPPASHAYPPQVPPAAAAQMFQVQVPANVGPGMPFQVNVGGQLMSVTCPQGCGPGSMIQIQAPRAAVPIQHLPAPVAVQQPAVYARQQPAVYAPPARVRA